MSGRSCGNGGGGAVACLTRTADGKAKSALNARKHGLAAAPTDPLAVEAIARLIQAVMGNAAHNPLILALAHDIAAAEYDILRVRRARASNFWKTAEDESSIADLARLDRYEHRARSRRKSAIRRFSALVAAR